VLLRLQLVAHQPGIAAAGSHNSVDLSSGGQNVNSEGELIPKLAPDASINKIKSVCQRKVPLLIQIITDILSFY
jgi:hypothetical protein